MVNGTEHWRVDVNRLISEARYRAAVETLARRMGWGIDTDSLTARITQDGTVTLTATSCAAEDGMPLPRTEPGNPLSKLSRREVSITVRREDLP